MNPGLLIALFTERMPFGKYEGRLYKDLPMAYLEWFNRKGWPKGKVGECLESLYEIKLNGLEDVLKKLEKHYEKTING